MEKRSSKLRSVLALGAVLLAVVSIAIVHETTAQGRPSRMSDAAFREGAAVERGEALVGPNAILQVQTLTLVKTVINDNGGNLTEASFPAFIDASSVAWDTQVEVTANVEHTASETPQAGYAASVWGGDCAEDGTITLAEDESKTCTITNDDQEPSLTLVKVVTNNNGGTATEANWTLTATGPTGFSGTGPTVSNGASFDAGTYDLSETGPGGYDSSAWVCTGTGTQDDADTVTLGLGESLECTITNDDQEPSLTLVKAVTNNNGGAATEANWTLTATGPTGFSGTGPTVSNGASFDAGTYDLSETGPGGYDASAWVCTGTGTQDDADTVTLGLGESLECTITNDDQEPSLTLVKVVTNNSGGAATAANWTLTATGPTGFSGTGPTVSNGASFDAGTYDLSETGPGGYDASVWVCTGTGTQDDADTVTLGLGESLECTITNDDVERHVSFTSVGQSHLEDVGTMTITVEIDLISGLNVFIPYTVSGTATEGVGDDFTITPSPVVVLWAGSPTTTIIIDVRDDSFDENDETVIVTMDEPTNAALGANTSHTATITDNDVAGVDVDPTQLVVTEGAAGATYDVVLTSQPTAQVNINFTPNQQLTMSPSPLVFTDTDWDEIQVVSVTAVDDMVAEAQPHFSTIVHQATSVDGFYDGLTVDNVSVTIQDNDSPGIFVNPGNLAISEPDGQAYFTMTLTSQPLAPVVIPLDSSNSECSVPVSVTLDTSNWSTGAGVLVVAVNDAVDDGEQTCEVLTGLSSSVDPVYHNRPIANVSVAVEDDDTAGVRITESGLGTEVTEGGAEDTYEVVLTSEPTDPVTITLSTLGQTTVSANQLVFTQTTWLEPRLVTVTAVNDLVAEGTHGDTIHHAISTEDTVYGLIVPEDVTVVIQDNDVAGIDVSPTVLTVSEPGTSDVFTITLKGGPAAPVIITVESTDTTECTASPPAVSLNEVNWDIGFRVTVTAVDDAQQDGPQTCMVLTGDATSADEGYDGLPVDDVTVTVLDNDRILSVYLPLLMRDWPPTPDIDPILGAEDGSYAVMWDAVPGATSYVLEEATHSNFDDAVVVQEGASRFYSVTGAGAGRRYYRARARGPWGEGRWSDSVWADVLWEAEPNNLGGPGGQANGPIVPDLIYLGELPSGADEKDYYYFDVTGPQTVEIWLTNIPAGQNYDLTLRSGAQFPTAIVWSVNGGNAAEYVRAEGLATGTYYIQVFNTGGGGSTEEYNLRMAFP